jgi:hypothetical protein
LQRTVYAVFCRHTCSAMFENHRKRPNDGTFFHHLAFLFLEIPAYSYGKSSYLTKNSSPLNISLILKQGQIFLKDIRYASENLEALPLGSARAISAKRCWQNPVAKPVSDNKIPCYPARGRLSNKSISHCVLLY